MIRYKTFKISSRIDQDIDALYEFDDSKYENADCYCSKTQKNYNYSLMFSRSSGNTAICLNYSLYTQVKGRYIESEFLQTAMENNYDKL